MTAKWEEMQPRERDAWIAENVMGYVWFRFERRDGSRRATLMTETSKRQCEQISLDGCKVVAGPCEEVDASGAPNYTTNASDDYLVLEKVRETWNIVRITEFESRLFELQRHRSLPSISYQPGDYSHAAFLALTTK